MLTVELTDVRFFAFHGLYPEERKTGNEFEVNLAVSYQPAAIPVESIGDTINYVKLYELVKAIMAVPASLLETLAIQITEQVRESFPAVKSIAISITKLHPPVTGFIGSVTVHYRQEY